MTLLSFLVMVVVANHSRGDDILHFNGLAKRSPFLAFAMLAAMLSLAGVPFTVGFMGKFLVFAAAVRAGQFVLVGIGIVTVAAGFYYYLRVVAAMYWKEPGSDTKITISPLTRLVIGGLTHGHLLLRHLPPIHPRRPPRIDPSPRPGRQPPPLRGAARLAIALVLVLDLWQCGASTPPAPPWNRRLRGRIGLRAFV